VLLYEARAQQSGWDEPAGSETGAPGPAALPGLDRGSAAGKRVARPGPGAPLRGAE
jgi:hypothetical protein